MTTTEFFATRCAAKISSIELADFAGASRQELLDVETGKIPVASWMISALNAMIARN